jgi:hypothetical protein
MLTFLARLIVVLLAGTIAAAAAWGLNLKRSRWLLGGGFVLGLLLASLAIAWRATLSPSPVSVEITAPEPQTEFSNFEITVEGNVSPPWARVYALVHPHTTDQWWVQNLPPFRHADLGGKSATWETTAYIGTETLGVDDSYDIIALASNEPLLLDILIGRYLQPAETRNELPFLNQSNVVTVRRVR